MTVEHVCVIPSIGIGASVETDHAAWMAGGAECILCGAVAAIRLDRDDFVCANCANLADWNGADISAVEVYWEGPAETCANCGAEITSAYGDPDVEDN